MPYRAQANADVVYTYWTGPSGTIIEGDIYNDGETYLEAVEIRVKLYDLNGDLIDKGTASKVSIPVFLHW